jgi:hypothetical protein
MNRLRIAPIVEGHGEVEAVGVLLRRLWVEMLGGGHLEVLKPIRRPRSKLARADELGNAVALAVEKLREPTLEPMSSVVLVLIDADDDPPCVRGPQLAAAASAASRGTDVVCVLANVEYETWFVAAAASLQDYLELADDELPPADPEASRTRKGWVRRHFRGRRYSETLDQPALTARMDLGLCRRNSPSFDKLCRELERRRRTP